MVRRCVVEGCQESDITLLAHRFPKTYEAANVWKKALNLQNSLNELQKRFVVCTRHFSTADYRNEISNSLNTTSVPNLKENEDNERIYNKHPHSTKNRSIPVRCYKLPPSQEPPNKRLRRSSLTQESPPKEQQIHKLEPFVGDCATFELIDNISYDQEPSLDQIQDQLVDLIHQGTQTDCVKEEVTAPVPLQQSKDEKLIGILYPDFQHTSKLKLIEMITEKSQKIETLEDKVKKLELAMRNLL